MAKNPSAHWHQKISKGWDIYGPPVRPSSSELKIIEKLIKRKKAFSRILVLGATPELRDLAHKLKTELTVCDLSLEMMIAMIKYMKYGNKAKDEVWVKSDWLKAPLRQGYWDVVLGDFVTCNMPFKLQNSFYKKIAGFLKQDGFFISRMYFANEPIRSFREVIEEYTKSKGAFNSNEFCLAVLSSTFNKNSYQIRVNTAKEFLKKYLKKAKGQDAQKVRKYLELFSFQYSEDKTWCSTPIKVRDKMLGKYFKILKKELGSGHKLVTNCQIYLLKKR